MAKVGVMTTGLVPSSLLKLHLADSFRSYTAPSLLVLCLVLVLAHLTPKLCPWCGLAMRPQGCRNRGSELGDSQAQELFQLLLAVLRETMG